jgi:hypothetical protein
MDVAAPGSGHGAVALDHRGHLLALIGMHDKYNFVVTHADCSSWTLIGRSIDPEFGQFSPAASPSAAGEARNPK